MTPQDLAALEKAASLAINHVADGRKAGRHLPQSNDSEALVKEVARAMYQNSSTSVPSNATPMDQETPEWTVKDWLAPLGVSTCVAHALLPSAASTDEYAAVRALNLTSQQAIVSRLVAGGVLEKLAQLLLPSFTALSKSTTTTAAPDDAFEVQSKFAGNELDFSGLDAFFDGLEQRVGVPRANVRDAMQKEHTAELDAHCEFTTGNYGVCTTSALEWAFVVDGEATRDWPVESEARLPDRAKCRRPVPLKEFLARVHEKNAQLRSLKMAQLIEAELVGARLYTGPMFVKSEPSSPAKRRAMPMHTSLQLPLPQLPLPLPPLPLPLPPLPPSAATQV